MCIRDSFNYIKGVLTGDLGQSWNYNTPVSAELARTIPKTLMMAVLSVGLMLLLGLPIGIISAVKQYSIWDNLSTAAMLILTSMPLFWLGLMLLQKFALDLKWFPATFPTDGMGTWKHWVLPAVTCMASMMASLAVSYTHLQPGAGLLYERSGEGESPAGGSRVPQWF